jgi:hypothetical protein
MIFAHRTVLIQGVNNFSFISPAASLRKLKPQSWLCLCSNLWSHSDSEFAFKHAAIAEKLPNHAVQCRDRFSTSFNCSTWQTCYSLFSWGNDCSKRHFFPSVICLPPALQFPTDLAVVLQFSCAGCSFFLALFQCGKAVRGKVVTLLTFVHGKS